MLHSKTLGIDLFLLTESHCTSSWYGDRGYSALFNFIMTKDFCFMSEISKNTFSLTSEIYFIFRVKNIEYSFSSNDISLVFEHVATLHALLYGVATTCYFYTEKIILLIFSQCQKTISEDINFIQWMNRWYSMVWRWIWANLFHK